MADTARVPIVGSARGTINLRVDDGDRSLIDRAAALLGKTRTQFMIDSAKQHAADVLLDQHLFKLDADHYDAFMQVLDNPPAPDAKLAALMRRTPPWTS